MCEEQGNPLHIPLYQKYGVRWSHLEINQHLIKSFLIVPALVGRLIKFVFCTVADLYSWIESFGPLLLTKNCTVAEMCNVKSRKILQ